MMGYEADGKRWCDCGDELLPYELKADACEFCQWWAKEKIAGENAEEEKPINLYAHEVRAILDKRQSQLRRVLKPQPPESDPPISKPGVFNPVVVDRHGEEQPGPDTFGIYGEDWSIKLPCQPGGLLWGRETWQQANNQIHYRADGYDVHFPWRSSTHMPRWASRITLRVADVRVQRVQEISEEDARAEGINDPLMTKAVFVQVWNSIHAKRPERQWAANPWVVAITFERVKP